jgi:hypothetical protein
MIILLIACSEPSSDKKLIRTKIEKKAIPDKKPSSSFRDTLKINSPAAVFYRPDTLQLEKIKLATDAKIFDGTMHEYFYLIRNAHNVLRKYYPNLKIIDAQNFRYLLFIKADKSVDCIDLDAIRESYGLFIFNSNKLPQFVDMANIDSALGFYFSK